MTPTLTWSELLSSRKPATDYPATLPLARRRYTYNGSAAIHAALQDMQLERGARVLLPAYCCGAELGPFEQLECEMCFYDIEHDFSIRQQTVETLLCAHPDCRVMLLTHYIGMAQPDVAAIADLCRAHDVCLIEDCAHALFSERDGIPLGVWGDYAIFSMRKTLPLSEGGALVGRHELRPLSQNDSLAWFSLARISRVAYSVQQGARSGRAQGVSRIVRYLSVAVWAFPALLSKLVRASGMIPDSHWLTPGVEGKDAYPVYRKAMSAFSEKLLESASAESVRERRRSNHAAWVRLATHLPGVEIVHRELPDGACPLYFLLRVADPGACVKKLAALDIEAFNWWQHLSPCITWQNYPVAREMKCTLLALPLHQQLDETDMVHMADCLARVLGSGKSVS